MPATAEFGPPLSGAACGFWSSSRFHETTFRLQWPSGSVSVTNRKRHQELGAESSRSYNVSWWSVTSSRTSWGRARPVFQLQGQKVLKEPYIMRAYALTYSGSWGRGVPASGQGPKASACQFLRPHHARSSPRLRGRSPAEAGFALCPVVREDSLPVDVLADHEARLGSSLCRSLRGARSCHGTQTALKSPSCLRRCCLPQDPPPARRCVCNGHGRRPTSTIWKFYQNEIQRGKCKLKNNSEKRAMRSSPPKGRHPVGLWRCGNRRARLMEEPP